MDSILNSITNSTEQDLSDETVYNLGAMTLEQESDHIMYSIMEEEIDDDARYSKELAGSRSSIHSTMERGKASLESCSDYRAVVSATLNYVAEAADNINLDLTMSGSTIECATDYYSYIEAKDSINSLELSIDQITDAISTAWKKALEAAIKFWDFLMGLIGREKKESEIQLRVLKKATLKHQQQPADGLKGDENQQKSKSTIEHKALCDAFDNNEVPISAFVTRVNKLSTQLANGLSPFMDEMEKAYGLVLIGGKPNEIKNSIEKAFNIINCVGRSPAIYAGGVYLKGNVTLKGKTVSFRVNKKKYKKKFNRNNSKILPPNGDKEIESILQENIKLQAIIEKAGKEVKRKAEELTKKTDADISSGRIKKGSTSAVMTIAIVKEIASVLTFSNTILKETTSKTQLYTGLHVKKLVSS